jgi:membrane protease YdiL (CAAX protease family)
MRLPGAKATAGHMTAEHGAKSWSAAALAVSMLCGCAIQSTHATDAVTVAVAARIISPAWFRSKSLELARVVADSVTGWSNVGRWSNPS